MNKLVREEQTHLDQTLRTLNEMTLSLKRDTRIIRDGHMKGIDNKKLLEIERAIQDAYFGRLDVFENGQNETIYIGKQGVAKNDVDLLIVDWRSHYGEVYNLYNGKSRTVAYSNSDGEELIATIAQKRHIQIKNQLVQHVSVINSDQIDEFQNNEILKDVLSKKGDKHQVKEIISSLQAEQDQIVRFGLGKSILVQGVAGSGKSSIALHRISYLLYRYKETLKPQNIMILAPNKMFLSYMKHVAPDLEIEQIQQSTFLDWAAETLKTSLKITEPHEKLSIAINTENEIDLEQVERLSKYKGSLRFKKLIDQYVDFLESKAIPPGHLDIDGNIILEREQILKMFTSKKHLPVNKRIDETIQLIRQWAKDEEAKYEKTVQTQFDYANYHFVLPLPEGELRTSLRRNLEDARDHKLRITKQNFATNVKKYLNQFMPFAPFKAYYSLYEASLLSNLDPNLNSDLIDELIVDMQGRERDIIDYDDLAALLHIQRLLNGIDTHFEHLVIDEAQDLYPFQLYALKQICKSMTVLGDVTQSIFASSHAFKPWETLVPDVFDNAEVHTLEINTSYRSTLEIMETANLILENSPLQMPAIIPFNRKGIVPKVEEILDPSVLLSKIVESIEEFKSKDYRKIAIICKDDRQTKALHAQLSKTFVSIQLILDSRQELTEQITIIPSYLVKGLEFDAVILPNASKERFKNTDLDAKLLFICLTRSNHEAHIYYHKEISLLLFGIKTHSSRASSDLYNIL